MEADLQNRATDCRQIEAQQLASTFKFLAEEEIEVLVAYLELRSFPADTLLMKEGEPGDFTGFLMKGRLEVKKETSFAGKFILLAMLDPGSVVGEVALADNHRAATVTALEDSQLLVLTRQRLTELTEREPQLGIKLLMRIIKVLGLRLQRADERLAKLL
jgi:CRP/FNR family transcriptional regulator, cyclic AMP receptor protein